MKKTSSTKNTSKSADIRSFFQKPSSRRSSSESQSQPTSVPSPNKTKLSLRSSSKATAASNGNGNNKVSENKRKRKEEDSDDDDEVIETSKPKSAEKKKSPAPPKSPQKKATKKRKIVLDSSSDEEDDSDDNAQNSRVTKASPRKIVFSPPTKSTATDTPTKVAEGTKKTPIKESSNKQTSEVSTPTKKKEATPTKGKQVEPEAPSAKKEPTPKKATPAAQETAKRGRSWRDPKPAAKKPGSKDYPVGADDCLKGKRFVITGITDGFSREELEDMIKTYGGTVGDVTKTKTHYALVGDEAGASKMKKIVDYKIKQISEDDLLEMINKTKPSKSSPTDNDDIMDIDDGESSQADKSAVTTRKTSTSQTQKPSPSTSTVYTPRPAAQVSSELWVNKYKPKSFEDLIGNEGCINELKNWLRTWDEKYRHAKTVEKPARGKKKEEEFRSAVISGVPGIGKTTTAKMVCQACGYEVKELNASDTRSKKSLQEEIGELTNNKTISQYFGKTKQQQKICIIMDEVDGMSSGDRGGVAELVKMIKTTRVPVICICNDRSKPALKTLISNSLDLKFIRPRAPTIIKRLEQICAKEKVKIDRNSLELLVKSLGNDIRSILNNLQLLGTKGTAINYMQTKSEQIEKTSAQQSIFDDIKDMFDPSKKNYDQYLNLYFNDTSLVPLFVQENYINMRPANAAPEQRIERIALAADSISMGDLVNAKIYSGQHFQLATVHADFSCIRPSYFVRGSYERVRPYDRYFSFPSCLGKQSTTNKNMGILRGIQKASAISATGTTSDMLHYMPLWRDVITQPLIEEGKEGVEDSIEMLDEYGLSKDDLISIAEISTFNNKIGKNPYDDVETATKSAFTRAFNKAHKGFSKASSTKSAENRMTLEDAVGEMDDSQAEEPDEDALVDALITKKKLQAKKDKFDKKQVAAAKKASKAKTTTKKASSSKSKSEPKKAALKLKK